MGNGRGTRKVVTAAHKLKNIQQNELLKIRVGEYDASGFNPPETVQHEEYTVVRLLKHPQFNAGRLSNDIALLYTDRDINLNKANVNSGKQCGTRNFPAPARGLQHGEASPGEFPWTCLVLNQNNDFIGSCAVIPNDSSNNNGRGTRKVVTAAHKLKNIQQNELLKIRVGEYDASGF